MANLVHRTAQHNRYSLRGQAPIIITYQQTASQRRKDAAARGLDKNWRMTRVSKRSRGLQRVGNTCFLLSGLQTLFHLPGFQNWILSHNVGEPNGTINFPSRSLTQIKLALRLKPKAMDQLQQCPACVVKRFVDVYWGDVDLNATTGHPLAFTHHHARMVALRNLDRAIKNMTSGAGGDDAQEDVCEFQDRLLKACLESTDYTIPANTTWIEHYNALFILEWDTTWHCECGTLQPVTHGTNSVDSIGHNGLGILPFGLRDSIALALSRNLTPEVLPGLRDCTTCPTRRPRTQTVRIDAAPEYLRVKLIVSTPVFRNGIPQGYTRRNNNMVRINHILDLTQYQAVAQYPAPLKYRLIGAMCHAGGTENGHYTATVTGPEGVSHVDDDLVQMQRAAYLRGNPHNGMQVVVVWYVRVHGRGG